jgi:hypothetical protein
MMSARFVSFLVGSLLLSATAVAEAEPMDPALERLVLTSGTGLNQPCAINGVINQTTSPPTNPPQLTACQPDNKAFKRLINQFAFALAPSAMHSARTTGYGGFNLAIEADYTSINSGADYWKRGTQGPRDPNSNSASIQNGTPQSILQVYSLKLRKSFGFGLEVTGVVGFMPKTSIISGGSDVRLALLEGFRTGVMGIFPDVAVGGGVRTITGTPEFQLTVVGLDAQISKPLPIADSSILTPWIGYQYLWIFGDSGLIDLTPGTNGVQYCNYGGINQPGTPDPNKTVADGQPVCRGGSPIDFNNNVVFNPVRLRRQRLMFGLNYRYEMVLVGGQVITDLVSPADANSGSNKSDLSGEPRQWTAVVELGALF